MRIFVSRSPPPPRARVDSLAHSTPCDPPHACLAHSPSIEFPISVLAFRGQFVSTFGMVAILAHSRGIVLLVHVLALGDLLAVLDSFVVLFGLFFATLGLMGDLVLDLDLI